MASTEKPSVIIQKARRKLTEALLQIEPEVILGVVDAHLLLSQGEYFSLSRMKDPQGLIQDLIDTVLRKGEAAHEQFLDCLENLRHAFPSLRPLSEYLETGPVSSRNKLHISSGTVFLEKGGNAENTAQDLDSGTPFRVPQERNMDENPDPSVSSEARKGVEKPGMALPSGNRSGAQNLDAAEDGNGVERPGVAAAGPQEGGQAENVEISVSLEAAGRAESPNIPLPSRAGSGVEILDISFHLHTEDTSGEQSGTKSPARRERTESSNQGSVDLRHEAEIQSAAVLLMSGAEKLGPAMIPERGDEVESPDPSGSSEAGKEVEKPDAVPGPSGTGSSAENPDVVLSSTQGDGVKNQDATEDANGMDKPGPVDLSHEAETQSAAVLLMSGTEKLGAAMSPAGGSEVESLDPSVSSEAGMEAEKPDAVPGPSGMGSEAENPEVVLSSNKGNGVKNEDATEDTNGTEKPATKQLSTTEDFAKLLHTTNTPGSTPAEERSCSAESEQNLKRDISPGLSPQGSENKLMIPANEIISRGRKPLVAILENDLDLVLDELVSASVITEEEYETFNRIEEDSKKSRKLLLLIQKKGEMACCQFLKHLDITCPGSNQVLQCSVHRCSSPEQKAEVQQEEKHPATVLYNLCVVFPRGTSSVPKMLHK